MRTFMFRVILCLSILLAANPVHPVLTGPVAGRPAYGAPRMAEAGPSVTRVTPEEAIARAVNHIQPDGAGYRLRQPQHEAAFQPDGMRFTPRRGGPEWAWRLTFVGAGTRALAGIVIGAVPPLSRQPGQVAYPRGGLVEQYLAQLDALEQQFVIARPLPLAGADLVIEGQLESSGQFAPIEGGWQWSTPQGAVRLGDVRVYDQAGRSLSAQMSVTAAGTRIVVDGAALAGAAYPVTIDPEIGVNDIRLSDMAGDALFAAWNTAVAYNSVENEYLVVWQADDGVDEESEIYAQRVDGSTGAEIGANDFRLSDMGPDGNPSYDAFTPAVAYNAVDNEYLVVWQGDDDSAPLVDEELEIFGQRVDGATGFPIGTNDFRLSDMGPASDPNYDAGSPAIAFNSVEDVYLVVWYSDDLGPNLVDNDLEIFGQQVDGFTGIPFGLDDFRLSDMGPNGNVNFSARSPDVAYSSADNEYLVVWYGDDDTSGLVDEETEIYGQRVDGVTGAPIGTNDFRLSDMGPDGDADYNAYVPAVAYNSAQDIYLVVWFGDDNLPSLVVNENEIYAQQVDAATGLAVGANDFRLSDMGLDGDIGAAAGGPDVTYNSVENEYLVVWHGVDSPVPVVAYELEVYGQRVDGATGAPVGANDFRLSDMGPDGNTSFYSWFPALAYNPAENEYLVVWSADDDTPPLVNDESEIYAQRMAGASAGEVGANDVRLSDAGPVGDGGRDASFPAVAYNSVENEYLVVWRGDGAGFADNDYEIYAQRVDAATGSILALAVRLSDMGPVSNTNYSAYNPAVAYNSVDNEYLVVWEGDDDTTPLANDEFEIFGVRVDGSSGATSGAQFRLSNMGPNGNPAYAASSPAVAFNSFDDEYLVVWSGDDNTPPMIDNDYEIFAQRVDGPTGGQVGVNDFRLSNMGVVSDTRFVAMAPAVAYDDLHQEYLVVWQGDDGTGGLVDDENEIYGQRLVAATGAQTGANDFRLSDMGPDGDAGYDALEPAVAYNSVDNRYLVVWQGDDNSAPLTDEEFEIFGQMVVGATSTQAGFNDFRLSDMGPDSIPAFGAQRAAVAYNSAADEFLVVWQGDDSLPPLVNDEIEIFGQRVSGAAGNLIGPNDFRLSDMGPNGSFTFGALAPAVAFSSQANAYEVVWFGDDNTAPLADEEYEIFGQLYSAVAQLFLPLLSR